MKAFEILTLEDVPTLPERKEKMEDIQLQLKTKKTKPTNTKGQPPLVKPFPYK